MEKISCYCAEFVGTFLLIFTVGCNVLGGNAVWGGVSIAAVLTVSIYAFGKCSGANFNPAVSLALGMANKMEWSKVGFYCIVQIIAGLCASAMYCLIFRHSFNLTPAPGFSWWQMAMCEVVYTFMLCFVVLNTAASKQLGGKNEFYGIAIGFVIVAGAYGAGHVSGGCFNPAVAIAIDTSSFSWGFGWCIAYTVFELIGAALAVAAFHVVRPEERDEYANPSHPPLSALLTAEALGTFMLVLTVGLNVLGKSKAGAFSIGASLMSMIYAVGDVSGAHFNPAVTLAILVRGKIQNGKAGMYMSAQTAAGVLAGFVYWAIHSGESFALAPGKPHTWVEASFAEIIFTFVLCFVVLCVATVSKPPSTELVGFIIGSCITVGGFAIGQISGGSLNPAVSIGISTIDFLTAGGTLHYLILYCLCEVLGGAAAAGLFRVIYPQECRKDLDSFSQLP